MAFLKNVIFITVVMALLQEDPMFCQWCERDNRAKVTASLDQKTVIPDFINALSSSVY